MVKVRVASLTQTCQACPAQWEGTTDDGRAVYVRFRWGCLSVRVSRVPTDDVMEAVTGTTVFERHISDGLDGDLGYEDLRRITGSEVDWP